MSTTSGKKFAWTLAFIAVFVVIAPLLWGYSRGCTQLGRRLFLTAFTRDYVPDSSVDFQRLMSGSGVGPKGSAFEHFQFHSTDCVNLETAYLTFGMENDAKEEMTQRINSAKRIVAPISQISSNVNGNRQGERAVIFDDGEYVILRRFGVKLHDITSTSLNHALEFERRGRFELETLGSP